MAVRLTDVSQRFGRAWVLARVHLEVQPGTVVLLSGGNGAGKTTLLQVMATALRPTMGQVSLFGLDAAEHRDTVRSRLALITHESYLYEELTALENLRLTAAMAGLDAQGRRKSVLLEALAQVGLPTDGRLQTPVRLFSAGMKRRLCMARLLLQDPELVLLDEPFGQLDPQGVQMVEALIQALRQQGKTVVFSTHDLARGQALSDVHIHLDRGACQVVTAEEGIQAAFEPVSSTPQGGAA